MTVTYFVMYVSGANITVVPDVAGSCANCKKECARRNPGFVVANPKGIALTPGDRVKIGTFSVTEKIRNIAAIMFPATCAVFGYFFPIITSSASPSLSSAGDVKCAGSAILFMALGALAVFIISRIIKPVKTLSVLRRV